MSENRPQRELWEIVESGRSDATEVLFGELSQQAHGGPGVEPETAAMFQAILDEKGPPLLPVLLEAAEFRIKERGVKGGAAVSAIRTAFVAYFRSRYRELGEEFSDAGRVSVKDWEEPFRLLKQDLVAEATLESMSIGDFYIHIARRSAATPVRERYASPELITQLCADRYKNEEDGVWALDIGCGPLIGALQLMHKDEFPMAFERVRVEKAGRETEMDVTDKANKILQLPSIINKVVGLDVYPYYSEESQISDVTAVENAISGLRPSERNNPEYMRVLHSLHNRKERDAEEYEANSGVQFHCGNLLKSDDLQQFREAFPRLFQLIIINYVTQELAAHEQLKLHDIACNSLAPNGILIYNHQARLLPRGLTQPAPISRVRHWGSYATTAFRSNMHLVDNLYEPLKVQEMMSYKDNRCREVRLGMGKLMVNGALESIGDLVQHA